MTKIYTITGKILFEDDSLSFKELVEKHKKDLYEADLGEADLKEADLVGANLRYAYLYGANLRGTNLRGADLRYANLIGADLKDANLIGADLISADLIDAYLRGAKILDATILNYKEIGGIGNNNRLLRCLLLNDNSFYFMAGCFGGTEKELKEKVIDKYGADCEYIEAIEYLKNLCKGE